MQVRIEDVSPVEKKMFVEIPWETVSAKLGEAYKDLGKGVALKGFRKGKVPLAHLKKLFGRSMMAEVVQKAVEETSRKAISDRNERPAHQPRQCRGDRCLADDLSAELRRVAPDRRVGHDGDAVPVRPCRL